MSCKVVSSEADLPILRKMLLAVR